MSADATMAAAPQAGPAVTDGRIRHENGRRVLDILRIEELSPRIRRIVLGGAALAGFVSAAPDDHAKLFFPPGRRVDPDIDPRTCPSRHYTPVRVDPARGELAIEFVVHGGGHAAEAGHPEGPAAAWAARAQPGDQVVLGGPRSSRPLPDGIAAWVLAGDETALPAISRILAELPAGARATALIEVEDAADERHLPGAAMAAITWLHRGGRPAGASGLLLEAVRRTPIPPDETFVWVAGETEEVRAIRRLLLDDEAIPKSRIRAAGYWKRGEADTHVPLDRD